MKYKHFPSVLKSALVISHGNADVERGFSENACIVTDQRAQLSEQTITSLRLVKDLVLFYGEPCLVPISKGLLLSTKCAYQTYQRRLEEERKEKEKKEIVKDTNPAVDETKRKRQEFVHEKEDIAQKEKNLEQEEKESLDKIKTTQSLLKKANEELQKALKKKDMECISVAQMMLSTATRKSEDVHKKLASIRKDQKKIEARKHKLINSCMEETSSKKKK
jgi:hypothetical protein